MTGSPPDYHLIIDICDFLLLAHPAANTYINHSKSEFFFNLAWGLPPSPLTQWKKEIATSTPVRPTRHTSETGKLYGKIGGISFDFCPSCLFVCLSICQKLYLQTCYLKMKFASSDTHLMRDMDPRSRSRSLRLSQK